MPEEPANVNVTSALPDDIRESVAVGNLKTLGESTSFYTMQQMAASTSHAKAMDLIREAAVGKIVESIIATQPGEGVVDIAAAQQLLKGAQTTPPPTA